MDDVKFIKEVEEAFGTPELWKIEVPVAKAPDNQHNGILKNFMMLLQTMI
jgi:hypothetical protein